LNVLAGEVDKGTVFGSISVNGIPVEGSEMKEISGFVFQDDVILATMTVKEAIMMAATLRLPSTVSVSEREERVEKIIEQLNLQVIFICSQHLSFITFVKTEMRRYKDWECSD
jgi:ABC-type multidrug transport system ATPase subunit